MRRTVFAFLLLFFSTNSWAMLITGISGVSNYSLVSSQPTTNPTTPGQPTTPTTTTTTTATIWGGIAGTGTCNPPSSNTTCDNCASTIAEASGVGSCTNSTPTYQSPLCACNQQRIQDGMAITVSATLTTTPTSPKNLYACYMDNGICTNFTPININTSYVTFNWSETCQHMQNGTNCSAITAGTPGTIQVTVYADDAGTATYSSSDEFVNITVNVYNPGNNENVFGVTSTDGIGQFSAFPGDGRIYFDDLNADNSGSWPTMGSGGLATYVRVYYSVVDLDHATLPSASGYTDLTLDPTNTPTPQYVDGLSNGTRYFFRFAILDQAKNIMQFFPDMTANLVAPINCDPTTEPAVSWKDCPYTAIPDQVLGILSKDINCFIATAAYGSDMEPKLRTFREFRYKTLLHSELGKRFVYAYYHYGPYPARFISDKPILKTMVRGLLWPLFGFAWVSNKYGFSKTLFASLILLAAMLALPWYGFRRHKARA